jgi:DNA-binding transcriptional ArsR family regulator
MVSVADRLDRTFGALADPTRRAILARLANGEASVTELAEPFEMSLPAVSKHLKVLERAARLRPTPIKEVAEWTDRYRRFWDERYDRLDEYLDELQGRGPSKRKEKGDGRGR